MSDSWKEYLKANQHRFMEEFLEFLRIPSVSTDPAFKEEVYRAAEWVANRLQQAGIAKVEIMQTEGHPVVYGESLQEEHKPTILIYGHYDVQPADPYELWTSPPFDPVVENGRVYARGSSDMKGNLLLPIIGCEALLQTDGTLPVNVKFLFEGEEEIGSPSLEDFIATHKDLLACNFVISADGGVGSKEEPVVNIGRRGIFTMQVNVKTADTDMHSGLGGGLARNAIHELVRILDSMRDEEGRILVEGFYQPVPELTEEERALIASFPNLPDELKEKTGIRDLFGEPEYTPMERAVARPTLEVNGIWGGYQGVGSKTVIPCEAHAKISLRLVPNQTPEQVYACMSEHIRRHTPSGIEVTVEPGHGADPYRLSLEHPALAVLEQVLDVVCGKPPKRRWEGSSVPVTSIFKRLLNVDTVTLAASQSDRVHAPNEFYRLENFERIQKAYCLFFKEIAKLGKMAAL